MIKPQKCIFRKNTISKWMTLLYLHGSTLDVMISTYIVLCLISKLFQVKETQTVQIRSGCSPNIQIIGLKVNYSTIGSLIRVSHRKSDFWLVFLVPGGPRRLFSALMTKSFIVSWKYCAAKMMKNLKIGPGSVLKPDVIMT